MIPILIGILIGQLVVLSWIHFKNSEYKRSEAYRAKNYIPVKPIKNSKFSGDENIFYGPELKKDKPKK